jgi:leucyl aminopeptidase
MPDCGSGHYTPNRTASVDAHVELPLFNTGNGGGINVESTRVMTTRITLETTPWTSAAGDWLIVGLHEGFEIAGAVGALDTVLGGPIARLREAGDFTGKLAETVTLPGVTGVPAKRILLVGLGEVSRHSERTLNKAVMTAARIASSKATTSIAVALPLTPVGALQPARQVQVAVVALLVGCVGQDIRKTEPKRFPFTSVRLLVDPVLPVAELQSSVDAGVILGEAVNLTRELVNSPAREIYPASFAARAEDLASQHGLTCTVLDEPALIAEKMGSLLAVSSGSDQPPRLVAIDYDGPGVAAEAPRLVLVGKGVTFDSGGLSLKTNDGMLTMKCDMAGAATVLASIVAVARLKLPVRVSAYMGLVENMTGGRAMKLGDVLTARSGTTIEVLNTDAEGRLVLADVLDYAISRGADYIVDLATLTGACVVALGEEITGAMTNNQPWCNAVLNAAESAGEDFWQLPMHEHFAKLIESDVADIKNVGGRWGGAITAAKFLERFVQSKPWVHLDIAGPAFAGSDKPHREGGATGCCVRTLVELAKRFPPT